MTAASILAEYLSTIEVSCNSNSINYFPFRILTRHLEKNLS